MVAEDILGVVRSDLELHIPTRDQAKRIRRAHMPIGAEPSGRCGQPPMHVKLSMRDSVNSKGLLACMGTASAFANRDSGPVEAEILRRAKSHICLG